MAQVTLGDVAIESRETYKGDKSGMPIVGLEHLIPEDVVLSLWDRDKENTFTKMFRKGDMLFGRRRAYLKKAAQAPFDGICSGDITVIRAKEDRLIPELLPFIIQNDVLFDFAVGKSAGSLSPRVKWENLKNYKFELPPLSEQKKLAEALWAINDTLQAYQKLLIETDELVKSQFIEMFGSISKTKTLSDLAEMVTVGIANSATHAYVNDGVLMFRNQNIKANELDDSDLIYIKPEFAKKYESKTLKANDILVARTGYPGTACLVPDKYAGAQTFTTLIVRMKQLPDLLPAFVCQYINSPDGQGYVKENEAGSAQLNFGATALSKMPIILPPLDLQEKYLAFVEQSDKSKFALQNAISAARETKRSIIADALGIKGKE